MLRVRSSKADRRLTVGLAPLTPLVTFLGTVGALLTAGVLPAAADDPRADAARLHLVVLTGPANEPDRRAATVRQQDEVLAELDVATPVYRWTRALNGMAVALTAEQADRLRTDPRVARVEADSTHRLAGHRAVAEMGLPRTPGPGQQEHRGGAGAVIGVVDTGLAPDHPLFADAPGLGRAPDGFTGRCPVAPDWPATACHRKVVGADWFVQGFGADRVSTAESLSPLDVTGHGTQVASVAAGLADVSVTGVPGVRDTFSGTAPQARVAAYKACWTAPDPDQDGCTTSDLVAAVDRAVSDGVDVLALAVAPRSTSAARGSALEQALLGAAEAGVVVVAAAGNHAGGAYAAYPVPWVTTVGALSSPPPRGRLDVTGGPSLTGAGRIDASVDQSPVVLGSRARADGASVRDASRCLEGALDAAATRGAVVVCRRGGTSRLDKSAAVRRADGIAMILLNPGPGPLTADVHEVPTVHLGARAGRRLVRHLRSTGQTRGTLSTAGRALRNGRVAGWSAAGNPQAALVNPDVVAPGSGVLAGTTGREDRRWTTFSGSSAAVARTAGTAARIRERHPDWSAARVHSALRTTARAVPDGSTGLRQGSGRLRVRPAATPGLAFDLGNRAYRRWLEGELATRDLNVPSLLTSGHGVFVRRVTNVGARAMYYSSGTRGFRHHRVRVEPAALRLAPGESAEFRVVVEPDPDGVHRTDRGAVVWRGAQGTTVRMPVVLSR